MKAKSIIFNLAKFRVLILGFDHCPLEFDVSGMPNISLFTSVGGEMAPKQCQVNTVTEQSIYTRRSKAIKTVICLKLTISL